MMQEIYQRGPIACGIAVTQEMEDYTSGIFEDLTGDLTVFIINKLIFKK